MSNCEPLAIEKTGSKSIEPVVLYYSHGHTLAVSKRIGPHRQRAAKSALDLLCG
jgi:hypothetical protein